MSNFTSTWHSECRSIFLTSHLPTFTASSTCDSKTLVSESTNAFLAFNIKDNTSHHLFVQDMCGYHNKFDNWVYTCLHYHCSKPFLSLDPSVVKQWRHSCHWMNPNANIYSVFSLIVVSSERISLKKARMLIHTIVVSLSYILIISRSCANTHKKKIKICARK